MKITFTIPGEPQGKGRARSAVLYGRDGKPITTREGRVIVKHHTPEKTVSYEGLIAHEARIAMGDRPPIEGAVALLVQMFQIPPASTSAKKRALMLAGEIRPLKKPDWDNVGKAVGDAGNGVLWVDDTRIVSATVEKWFGPRAEVQVTVCDLTGMRASPPQMVVAAPEPAPGELQAALFEEAPA